MSKIRRERLYQEQKGRCHWCRRQCTLTARGQRMFTIDHIIHRMDPIRRTKGWEEKQRTVGACFQCNQIRGKRDMERFTAASASL